MITVFLYGHLAKRYGREHRLNIRTPAEAIRAFCANYKDFRQAITLDGQMAYRVLAGKEDRADEQGLHLPAHGVLKIVPIVAGSGKNLGKIVLGAALIYASFYLPGLGGTVAKFAGQAASSIGFSLVIGGVTGLLFSPPKGGGSAEKADNKPSYNFNGPVNTTGQGNAIPVLYGELWIGGQVISAGTETVDL